MNIEFNKKKKKYYSCKSYLLFKLNNVQCLNADALTYESLSYLIYIVSFKSEIVTWLCLVGMDTSSKH